MTPSYTQVRDWVVQNGFEIEDGIAHTDTHGSIIVKPHPAVKARVDYDLGLTVDRDDGLSLWVNTPWPEVGPDAIKRSITDPVYIWSVPGDCNPPEALEQLGEVLTAELQDQLRCTEIADRTSESLIAMSAMLGCHGTWALDRIANQLYRHLEKLAQDDDGDEDDEDDGNQDEDNPTPIGPASKQLVISANGRHRLNGVLHA
jgi:hypothetical protein